MKHTILTVAAVAAAGLALAACDKPDSAYNNSGLSATPAMPAAPPSEAVTSAPPAASPPAAPAVTSAPTTSDTASPSAAPAPAKQTQ